MGATLDEAREAKKTVRAAVGGLAEVVGIGIGRIGDSFAVKVNLDQPCPQPLPQEVDGVPVVYEVVGRIVARRPEDQ